MARADLLVGLVRAARQQDETELRRTVEAMAAEEREKQYIHLMDEGVGDADFLDDVVGGGRTIHGSDA